MSVKYCPKDYLVEEKLYRAYKNPDDLDDEGEIRVHSIRFPDFSVNWSRFSVPADIKNREGGEETDGCYSITVGTARHNAIATPCHDPLKDNYSHTEIRQLIEGEDIFFEPPKERSLRSKRNKKERKIYRQNIVNNHIIEIEAKRQS